MRTALKLVGIVLTLALLAGVMAYLAGFFEPKIPIDFKGVLPAAEGGSQVSVTSLTETVIEQAAGTVRAKTEAVISPLITASIVSIGVRAGDEVAQGDLLVVLDARDLGARAAQARQAVASAQAELGRAEKEYQRIQRIYQKDSGAVSTAQMERMEAAQRIASAELERARQAEDEARTARSYAQLASPIAGRVVERYADPGDTALQGEPLLRIYDPTTLRLEASVRESVASLLAKKQKLTVKIDALDRQLDAVVDEIVPSADPGSRSFLVKATLSNADGLYPGMFGRLLIPLGEAVRITIPREAVTRVGQLDFVIVAGDRGPVRRYVRVGEISADGLVTVVSGLTAGEKVIIAQ